MRQPDNGTRIYVNWERVRPRTLRGWATAFAFVVVAILMLALFAAIASTLLVIAAVIAVFSTVTWFVSSLFRRRSRDVVPYRENIDA
jgi:heme A synthase